METVEEIVQALFIGTVVASILLQTCRYEKAIELFNECLVVLKQHASKLGKDYLLKQYSQVCDRLCKAYCSVDDCKNAFECSENILEEIGDVHQLAGEHEKAKENYNKAANMYVIARNVCTRLSDNGDVQERKRALKRELQVIIKIGDKKKEGNILMLLGDIAISVSETHKAIEYYKAALAIWTGIGNRKEEGRAYTILGELHISVEDFKQAKQYYENALVVAREVGDRNWQGIVCGNLGHVYSSLNDFAMAKTFVQEALEISIENGDVEQQGNNYHNLASYCWSLKEYDNVNEYYDKSLTISKQIGDKKGEAVTYSGLGDLHRSRNQYTRAEESFRKALEIRVEICDKQGEGIDSSKLGGVFKFLGKYEESKTCYERALEIHKETGNKKEEGIACVGLGDVYRSLGDYAKSIECQENALALSIETNDRRAQGIDYGNLAVTYHHLGDFVKAKELHEKALHIKKQTAGKDVVYSEYIGLGQLLKESGEYVKAREYFLEALGFAREISDQRIEASVLGTLASLERSLDECVKAKEYSEKALQIMQKIGDIQGESNVLNTLGGVYHSLGDIAKAMEYHEKSLAISKRIGDKDGEGTSYSNLGVLHGSLDEHAKAIEFHKKALVISKETQDKNGEIIINNNLGSTYIFQKEYKKAQECLEEALLIADKIGHLEGKSTCLGHLAAVCISCEKFPEALLYYSKCITILEGIHASNADSERYQIAFADQQAAIYRLMVSLLCRLESINLALSVSELGKARSLAEVMVRQYSSEDLPCFHQIGLFDFRRVAQKDSCTCLSFLFVHKTTFIWVLNEDLRLRTVPQDVPVESWIDTLASQGFRMFPNLLEEHCEDRSLNALHDSQANETRVAGNLEACRLIEEDEENDKGQEQSSLGKEQSSLKVLHSMLIAPVAHRLTGSEIIIVPDRSLYRVPFSALMDESGEYLSEKFRIRFSPSLTILKLIQESPADYHSEIGALIIGDPDVATVMHQGRQVVFPRLPFAKQEAEMIGRLLDVHPLTGKQATKQTVLQKIHSVSLIHIAAHGDSERGDIALAPSSHKKDDFLLSMADISKVQLRAKLVVLSCCHSGCGQIKSEGVVGIARAFLGSGARSVLVSLWAVDDNATMQFMKQFYEHLVRGESASQSLHETMKWMRGNPQYCEVRKWAPFMLIGDDVSFNFAK